MKIYYLKKALSINPNNQVVIKALSKLEQPPQPTLEELVPNQVIKIPSSLVEPISNEAKPKITAQLEKPALNTQRVSSPVKKTSKTPTSRKIFYFAIFGVFLIFACCGIYWLLSLVSSNLPSSSSSSSSSSSNSSGSSSNSSSGYLSIGDEGVLYNGSDQVPVAVTKDVLDQVIHMSTANDTLGYAQLVGAGLVIRVDSGTKVLILDSTVTYKQVRILEGEYVGESGWIPVDWVKK